MRKFAATFVLMALLLMATPFTANAQSRCRTRNKRSYATRSHRSYAPARYYSRNNYYAQPQRPSFYRRHRNLINIGIATGAGAGIGALAGGKRGALIGTASGAGLGALYTYVLKAKKRRY